LSLADLCTCIILPPIVKKVVAAIKDMKGEPSRQRNRMYKGADVRISETYVSMMCSQKTKKTNE
jgi:hypothetical protein